MKAFVKRSLIAALALCLIVISLSGCSGGNVGANNRSGVVRVAALYDADMYLVDITDDSITPMGRDVVAGFGSAFGVGKAGKETEYYVTNRHVVNATIQEPIAIEGSDTQFVLAVGTLSHVYILLDDFAISSDLVVDTNRAVPCDIIYRADADEPDLAVLQSAEPIKGRKALPLRKESNTLDSGDKVWALGYPTATDEVVLNTLGDEKYYATVEGVTVTDGVVSLHSTYGSGRVRVIQHTASINHGNSGGPLLDKHGAVVGVNTWGTESENLNYFFSIEVDYLWDILEDLHIKPDPYEPVNWLVISAVAAGVLAVCGIAVLVVVLVKKRGRGGSKAKGRPAITGAVRIQGTGGAFAGRRFPVDEGRPLRLGVDPGPNGLKFPDRTPGVSRSHAQITLSAGHLTIQDLGSTYGTFVNGQRIPANVPVEIGMGDSVSLGSDKQTFTVTGKGGV